MKRYICEAYHEELHQNENNTLVFRFKVVNTGTGLTVSKHMFYRLHFLITSQIYFATNKPKLTT